jgi:hypothetical protein
MARSPVCPYCHKAVKPHDFRMGFGAGTEQAKKVSRGLSKKQLLKLDPDYGEPWFGKIFSAAKLAYHWSCAEKAGLVGPTEKMVKKEHKRRRTVASRVFGEKIARRK